MLRYVNPRVEVRCLHRAAAQEVNKREDLAAQDVQQRHVQVSERFEVFHEHEVGACDPASNWADCDRPVGKSHSTTLGDGAVCGRGC